MNSVASRPRQPDVLFGSTCDQLPDRHLHPFNENVVAAFTGPGDGLAELQQKQQQPAILSSNELASVKACTRMLDSLQVDFIDDEDSSDSNGDLSPIPIKSPVQTYSDLLKSIDRKRSIPATNKSSPNVYSFAHTDLRPGNSTSTPKLMDKDRNYREIRTDQLNVKPIRSIDNWKQSKSFAFGASVSLYEQHPADGRKAGEPLADCFGIVARGNNACLALADGVNWGPGSRLAATSAVNGAIEYLNSVLIETKVQTTTQLFEQLLR